MTLSPASVRAFFLFSTVDRSCLNAVVSCQFPSFVVWETVQCFPGSLGFPPNKLRYEELMYQQADVGVSAALGSLCSGSEAGNARQQLQSGVITNCHVAQTLSCGTRFGCLRYLVILEM
jgi:hypothetical protein